jgi:hypothetical protein
MVIREQHHARLFHLQCDSARQDARRAKCIALLARSVRSSAADVPQLSARVLKLKPNVRADEQTSALLTV